MNIRSIGTAGSSDEHRLKSDTALAFALDVLLRSNTVFVLNQ
jgi:hypothetical protein